MSLAVAVHDVVKTYRGWWGAAQPALRGLTLSIPTGSAFGLIGPNGAGKTTFIKLLLAVAKPDQGAITVLCGSPEQQSVRARIGYLPERMHLPAALTGLDFLQSVATLRRLRLNRGELRGALERVGLGVTSQRTGTYSKGMRQRLGLAAAMLGNPDLLVLDEPTDGIDPVGRVEVRELLLEERRRGATLLLNSHLLSETERVCDRIGILDRGVLRLEGSLDDITRAKRHWRLRFAPGAPAQSLIAAGFVAEGSEWAFHAPHPAEDVASLNQALDVARSSGAQVVELVPASRDLEQVLAEALTTEGAAR